MEDITAGDCAWILSNAFLILTMQSGFGLLEAGFVSTKNMANIMIKNVVDVCMGGITYWAFGYGFAFGEPSNWFCGWGSWFATEDDERKMGTFYTRYVFQFSFATAATTIVSGALAERMKLSAYILFSIFNTFVYVFPASWAWNKTGFLKKLGFQDFAGSCIVHLTGGTSALVMAKLVGPRIGRFDRGGKDRYRMSSPVTALTGTFMLWWAWLAFNCGSTFAIEGIYWKMAAKVGTNTLNGSIGGGIASIVYSLVKSRGKTYDIGYIITGLLGGLVGVTAGCGSMSPFESLIVGACAALIAISLVPLMERINIDDPVGAVPVHFGAASFGTIAVGVFGHNEFNILGGRVGLVHGGYEQFLVQVFGMIVVMLWAALSTLFIYLIISLVTGTRMSEDEELLGADLCEHNVKQSQFAIKLEEAFMSIAQKENITDLDHILQQLIMQVLEATNRVEHGQRVTMPPSHNLDDSFVEELNSATEQTASTYYHNGHAGTLQSLQGYVKKVNSGSFSNGHAKRGDTAEVDSLEKIIEENDDIASSSSHTEEPCGEIGDAEDLASDGLSEIGAGIHGAAGGHHDELRTEHETDQSKIHEPRELSASRITDQVSGGEFPNIPSSRQQSAMTFKSRLRPRATSRKDGTAPGEMPPIYTVELADQV